MIEWIVTGSTMIVLVLVLRRLVGERVSPRLRYALWLLALLRLLLPGTLWESPASVMTPVAAQEVYQAVEQIPRYVRTEPDGGVTIGSETGWVFVPKETIDGWEPSGEVNLETLREQVNWRNALLGIWLAGSAAAGIFLLAVNLRFYWTLRRKRRPAGQYRGRTVYTAEGLPSPCLFGLFRPAIYLTPELPEDEKAHILAHEFTHFRQGDQLWALLRSVCLMLHWYNPLVWAAAVLSRRDGELSCDEGAVRLLGEAHRAAYGRTLVGLVARKTAPADLLRCATTMTGGRSAVKERIALLVAHPRTTAAMAFLVTAACMGIAVCTFTGAAAAEPETSEVQDPVLAGPAALAEEVVRLLEKTKYAPGSGILDSRVNKAEIREWQVLPPTGDQQASFDAEIMIRVLPGTENDWMAGNTVKAEWMEDEFYRAYDGWLVFWRQGILAYDKASGAWSIPEMGTGGYALDSLDLAKLTGSENDYYRRFQPIPEDLPAELLDLSLPKPQEFTWQLLAELPEEDIALYRTNWDDGTVYLRYGEHFQVFAQDLSKLDMLPEIRITEGDGDPEITIDYQWHEGVYFNGEAEEPAVLCRPTIYDWNGEYWRGPFYYYTSPIRLTSDAPPDGALPTRVVTPGSPEAEAAVWLAAELPEAGIAVYYEPATGHSWLAWEGGLQQIADDLVCMPQMLLPELIFDDLDGDGEQELILISQKAAGSGVSAEQLSVYEWDGESWTWTTHDPAQIAAEFNSQRVYQFYDGGMAYISCYDTDLLLDLRDLWELGYWDSPPDVCALSEWQANYRYQDGQLLLILGGEIVDTGGHFLHGYTFEYDCPILYIDYHGGGPGHLASGAGVLRSEFAAASEPPALPEAYRAILARTLAECDPSYQNAFAVHDVNGDGTAELLVRWMPAGAMSSAWGTSIYSANGQERFHGHGELTFYSNGVLSEPWSHNQGQACAIWPYNLYQFHPQVGYQEAGSARAISNEMERFPKEADLDGDGMVYYIDGDAFREENPVDNDVYQAWRDQILAGAEVLPVRYFPLTEERIASIP